MPGRPGAATEALAAGAFAAAAGRKCFAPLGRALPLCLAAALGVNLNGGLWGNGLREERRPPRLPIVLYLRRCAPSSLELLAPAATVLAHATTWRPGELGSGGACSGVPALRRRLMERQRWRSRSAGGEGAGSSVGPRGAQRCSSWSSAVVASSQYDAVVHQVGGCGLGGGAGITGLVRRCAPGSRLLSWSSIDPPS